MPVRLLSRLQSLERWDLSGNRLQELPKNLELPALRYLDLSDNQMEDVTTLESLRNLEELKMEDNLYITVRTGLKALYFPLVYSFRRGGGLFLVWSCYILKDHTIVLALSLLYDFSFLTLPYLFKIKLAPHWVLIVNIAFLRQVSDNYKLMVLLPNLRIYNSKDVTTTANHLRFVYSENLRTRVRKLLLILSYFMILSRDT